MLMMEDNRGYFGEVHPVFIEADRLGELERMENRKKMVKRKPRIYPVPTITSNPNIEGPLYVTQEYADKFYETRVIDKRAERLRLEKELFVNIEIRNKLYKKLSKYSYKKGKDIPKIISMKLKIREIEETINMYQEKLEIKIEEMLKPTKIQQVIEVVTTTIKSVSKFINKHKDTIYGMCAIIIPSLFGAFFSKSKVQPI